MRVKIMETLVISIDNEKDVTTLIEQLKDITFIKNITWEKHKTNPLMMGPPFSDEELNALLDEAEADESFTMKQVQAKLDDKFGSTWKLSLGKERI